MLANRVKILVAMVLLMAGVAGIGRAQDSGLPLVFLNDGDFWVWSEGDAALTQLTQDAHIYTPEYLAFGPDGTWTVVQVLSPVTVDAVARVGGFSGTWPTDLALVRLISGALVPIATQPDDARLFADDGQPDNVILRSEPAWSPDGTYIAWTELHYPSFAPESSRLMTYQLLSGETREIVTGLPESAGAGPSPLAVRWGTPGIAVAQPAYDETTATFPTNFMIYDAEGTLLTTATIPDDGTHVYIDFDWLQTGPDSAALGVVYADGTWDMITLDGAVVPVTGVVEQVSALAPGTSLATRYTNDLAAASYVSSFNWQVRDPLSGQVWTLDYHRYQPVMIAADGRTLAYLNDDGTLVIWRDGQAQPYPLGLNPYSSVWWGPVVRQVTAEALPAATAEPVESVVCEGALPARLAAGGQARVVPTTTPNNVRSAPNTTAAVLGQIPAGGTFAVLDGPVCADGYTWWQIDYNGLSGWTVEGDASTYWLEPLS